MKKIISILVFAVAVALSHNSAFAAISTEHFVRVEKGDNMYSIASDLHIDFVRFVQVNKPNLRYSENPDLIYPGQILDIPADAVVEIGIGEEHNNSTVESMTEQNPTSFRRPAEERGSLMDAVVKTFGVASADKENVVRFHIGNAPHVIEGVAGKIFMAITEALGGMRGLELFMVLLTFFVVFLLGISIGIFISSQHASILEKILGAYGSISIVNQEKSAVNLGGIKEGDK